eukprot:6469604-Ditylum_brightwellii.AAC.1
MANVPGYRCSESVNPKIYEHDTSMDCIPTSSTRPVHVTLADGTNTWVHGRSFDLITELDQPQILTFTLYLKTLDDWATTTLLDIEMKMTAYKNSTLCLRSSAKR